MSRRAAIRPLLAPARIRESFAVAAPPSLRNAAVAGLQTSLAVLIVVAATHLSPWAHLEGYPALGALAALFGRFAPAERRMPIVALAGLLLTAPLGLLSAVSMAGAAPATMLLCLALLAGVLSVLVNRWRIGAPGVVIFVFAACAGVGPVDSWRTVVERTAFTAAGAAVAWWICRASDSLRADPALPVATAADGARPALHAGIAGARIALCAATAALLALAAGWAHPAWAAIGATAVMQGTQLHITMHRAVQRTVGTVLGAGLAWLFLAHHPTFWWVLLAVVLLQFATELVIGFNYVFGLICVTPMALLMTSLAAPHATAGMPMARVLDTVLGALVGIAFALLFSTLDDRAHLAAHHEKARAG
ncbi:FUSC family protein [Variovorax saccharolyticus]|uniref:FUSC family protein n=1 Tax=Variovorax saccharolyticus TaxID=3053516 RepID=UPI002577854E|nr:FUSC family protein [Variovorax sp. J31P216]MDM0029729.1 FUSC family protein [Variovorax sp. J31P216]